MCIIFQWILFSTLGYGLLIMLIFNLILSYLSKSVSVFTVDSFTGFCFSANPTCQTTVSLLFFQFVSSAVGNSTAEIVFDVYQPGELCSYPSISNNILYSKCSVLHSISVKDIVSSVPQESKYHYWGTILGINLLFFILAKVRVLSLFLTNTFFQSLHLSIFLCSYILLFPVDVYIHQHLANILRYVWSLDSRVQILNKILYQFRATRQNLLYVKRNAILLMYTRVFITILNDLKTVSQISQRR